MTLLRVDVPADVALLLFEGDLGPAVAEQLERIPTDVGIDDPAATEVFAPGYPAREAWRLLEQPFGMGWVITNKLLARKGPKLIPVYDQVVQCAFGHPAGLWNWLVALFTADGGVLHERLLAARTAAGVPAEVTALRVLDIIMWMRHREGHLRSRCPGSLS